MKNGKNLIVLPELFNNNELINSIASSHKNFKTTANRFRIDFGKK